MTDGQKKIRVAQVITRMDWGGSPDILRMLAAKLDGRLFDQHFFIGDTRYPSAATKAFFRDYSEKITFIPALRRDVHPLLDMAACWQLYRHFRATGFDIVHTHTAKAGALGRIAARLAGVRAVVHTAHGHNFYGYFNRMGSAAVVVAERMLSGITDRLMVLTELELADCLSQRICPAEKLALVRTAFDMRPAVEPQQRLEMRRRRGIADSDEVIGFVGRLEPVKGADTFIEACLALLAQRRQCRVIIAGEGSLRPELEQQVDQANMRQRVDFLGWVDDAAGLMPLFDVLALPSRNEAVGIALLEAQAAGVAVVASRVGGIPEAVAEGRTALLIPAQDPLALLRALNTLLDDARLRQAMGANGRQWIVGRFSPERFAAETARLYCGVLGKSR